MKKEYENKIKSIKTKYNNSNNNIINKYRLEEEKLNSIFLAKEENYKKKIKDNIKEFETKIENLTNINTINELVYNTYNIYKNNIYNAININHLILNYYKNNDYIKNKIIKNILKDDYKRNLILKENKNINGKDKEINEDEINRINQQNQKSLNFKDKTNEKIEDKEIKNIVNNNRLNLPEDQEYEYNIVNINNYLPELKNNIHKKIIVENYSSNPNQIHKINLSKKETNDENLLFNIFNNIFFKDKLHCSIKEKAISENDKRTLKKKYISYKKEKKEKVLVDHFVNFLNLYVLKFLERKNPNPNIIKNIEAILDCFESEVKFGQIYAKYNNQKDNKKIEKNQ